MFSNIESQQKEIIFYLSGLGKKMFVHIFYSFKYNFGFLNSVCHSFNSVYRGSSEADLLHFIVITA